MVQSDTQGNKFIFDMFPDSIQIKLKLANEQRTRHIGHINCKRQFVIKRSQSAHLHIKSQSYGFNHYLLENAKFTYILTMFLAVGVILSFSTGLVGCFKFIF